MKTKAQQLPREILVYEMPDSDLMAQRTVDEISEEHEGGIVGVYVLQRTHKFSVKRELK